jgi:hypothetical protein
MSTPRLETGIREAVRLFWRTRGAQAGAQGAAGGKDRGQRAAVTGGAQMNGFVALLERLIADAGMPPSSVSSKTRIELPGWFRAEKKWDLVVVHEGRLIAAVELKSHVGPSFGNNFNNRTEESIGSAADLWAAYREGAFSPSAKPWLGYLMLLEECPESGRPVGSRQPHFPVFDEFAGASYARRYQILLNKLQRERLYDASCLLLTGSSAGQSGDYSEPDPELGAARFIGSLLGRVAAALG